MKGPRKKGPRKKRPRKKGPRKKGPRFLCFYYSIFVNVRTDRRTCDIIVVDTYCSASALWYTFSHCAMILHLCTVFGEINNIIIFSLKNIPTGIQFESEFR